MVPISTTEVAKQIRVMSAWLKEREQRQTQPLTEEAMAGFFEQVRPLTQAGWTRPKPNWPYRMIKRDIEGTHLTVIPAEDAHPNLPPSRGKGLFDFHLPSTPLLTIPHQGGRDF